MSLLGELKRRGVVRVALAYLAVAWLVLQVAEMLLPVYGFTDAAIRNLVTLLGAGLLVAVTLSWVFEWTPGGIVKSGDMEKVAGTAPGAHRGLDRFIVLVLVIAVAFFIVDKFMLDPARDRAREQEIATQARTEAMRGAYGGRSIAVLAFEDLSPEGDQEYFSDGISEEVLNLLAKIPELRVAGRTSAFAFKGKNNTIPEIGTLLEVAHVLEGSVRKAGQRVRVTAQLIDARTDTHLWSESYDRELEDIFAIQDEIAERVVAELKIRLLDGAPSSVTVDPVAYENYLKARFILHSEDASRLPEAGQLLQEALDMAPDYLPALDQLFRLNYLLSDRDCNDDSESRLRNVAERIAAIDPDSVEALGSGAMVEWLCDGDMQRVADLYAQALRTDPGNIDVLRGTAFLLIELERFDEAIAVLRHLVLREPSCVNCLINLVFSYRKSGRYEEAAQVLQSQLRWGEPIRSYYWNLGVIWLGAGEPEKALAAFEQEKSDIGELWWLLVLHDLGRTDEFERRFAAFRSDPGTHPEAIARIYAYTGNADKAFEWLEKMFEQAGVTPVHYIDSDIYNNIKSDPRWQTLLRERYGNQPQALDTVRFELPPNIFNTP